MVWTLLFDRLLEGGCKGLHEKCLRELGGAGGGREGGGGRRGREKIGLVFALDVFFVFFTY